MAKRPTLIDVGIEAGVSAITVSRALRNPDKVSDSMRRKVNAAVKKLGYAPNPAASALASRRSNVIGVLVPSFSNSVFADVLDGIYSGLEGSNYSIQIGNIQYSPLTEERLIPDFLNLRPAGIIVSGVDQTNAATNLLKNAGCPLVQVMDICTDPIDMVVGFSHYQGAVSAVDHMIAQGFTRIGFLGAQMDSRTQKRMAGYRSSLEANGLYDPKREITTQH
jgi:LacI family gluconate utilization system Gnt-I transcriptional repressor